MRTTSTDDQTPAALPRMQVVDAILRDILRAKLKAGERLIGETLAKRFGVSQTPIREALLTLEGMGVIQSVPHRGAVVRKFTGRELREIWRVRICLECEAIRTACGRGKPEQLHRLRDTFRKLITKSNKVTRRDVQLAIRADSELHEYIRTWTRNRFLATELERIMSFLSVVRDVAWDRLSKQGELGRVSEEAQQHLEIVEAMLANRPDHAVRALRNHLKTGTLSIVRAIEDDEVV